MFKSEAESCRFWMTDKVHTRLGKINRFSFLLWSIWAVGSFWVSDWEFHWPMAANFISGFFFGYWVCTNWVNDNAGSMEL